MIIPPPDLKNFITKTASFVRKNGKVFEDKIKEREKGNPKFTFLFSSDPYHPYYVSLLEDPFFSERNDSVPESSTAEITTSDLQASPHSIFLSETQTVSPLDLALMKLVARYVLVNGHAFILSLFARESNNHLFDFLKPLNSMNTLFKSLIEQYSTINNHEKTTVVSTNIRKRLISQLCVKDLHKDTENSAVERISSSNQLINFDHFSLVDFFEVNNMAVPVKPINFAEFVSSSNTYKIALWTDSSIHNKELNTTHITCSICLSRISADKYADHMRNELYRAKVENVLK